MHTEGFPKNSNQQYDFRGINETHGMAGSGHKTNPVYKRYAIVGLQSKRRTLDAMAGD